MASTDKQITSLPSKASKKQFLYRRVADSVLDDIRSGRYDVGDKLPPESQLQQQFQVSRIVVRQAMETLAQQRVIDRQPGRGTFVIGEERSDSKAGPDCMRVGLFCGYRLGSNDPYVGPVLHALTDKLVASDRIAMLYNTYDSDKAADVDAFVQRDQLDGVILIMPDIPAKAQVILNELLSLHIPTVALNVRSTLVDCVFPDHYSGGYQAAEHLIELGHRQIWALTRPNPFVGWQERMDGFRDAIQASGEEVTARVIPVEYGDEYSSVCEHLRKSDCLPTAIFSGDDQAAVRVVTALMRYDIRVPEQISVMGFNDIHMEESHVPSLTTVHVPLKEMANHGVRMLDRAMSARAKAAVNQQMLLSTRVVARESTAAPREDLHLVVEAGS